MNCYEIRYQEENGRKGYYTSYPLLEVVNQSSSFEVDYLFINGEEQKTLGKIEPGKIENFSSLFTEGKNILQVWKEESGVKSLEQTKVFYVDTQPVKVELKKKEYLDQVIVNICAVDETSGVYHIEGFINNQKIDLDTKKEWVISKTSSIKIKTEDIAGNVKEYVENVYINYKHPDVEILGGGGKKTFSDDVKICICIKECRNLENADLKIEYIPNQGKTESLFLKQWEKQKDKWIQTILLSKEGRYEIYVKVADKGRNEIKKHKTFVIDKSPPVFHDLSKIDKKSFQKFCFEFEKEELIWDCSMCKWRMWIDDHMFCEKEIVDQEGRHHLRIEAEDEAGNVSEKIVSFQIDQTPPRLKICGVKNNEKVKGPVNFRAETQEKADWINKIIINGENRKLKNKLNNFKECFKTPGYYEIKIDVRDEAGNSEAEFIKFQILDDKEEKMYFLNIYKYIRKNIFVIFFLINLIIFIIYIHIS